jgi:hypothetical protein
MKQARTIVDRLRAAARGVIRTAAGTAAVVAVALAWSLASSTPERADSAAAPAAGPAGWGSEALADVRDLMRAASPIAEANACGMGASSCFKCHNGTRAAAPSEQKWHTDHKSVDNSCIGCHKGNPRLIKKELAHAEMVKDPRPKHAEKCASCHKTGNSADLVKAYNKK